MSEENQSPEEVTPETRSWLADLTTVCIYRCQNGHESAWGGNWEEKPETLECSDELCFGEGTYARFEPIKLGGFQKVAYTQNGRQAYMIKDPSTGKIQYRSKAKDHYLESGGRIKEFNTPQYTEKIQKDEAVHTRRAKVQEAKAKEVWRDAANKAKRNS